MIKAKNIFGIPARFLTGGEFLFDLSSDFEIRRTKGVGNLDNENKVAQEIVFSVTLPFSTKNDLLLKGRKEPIQVEVYQNGEQLEIEELRVIEEVDGNGDGAGYQVDLWGSNWASRLEKIKLSDLDLGTFEYTQANALNTWSDREGLVVATVAHYGKWNQEGSVTRKDLRMWFNLGKLAKAALCKIGWEFESPYWDNEPGKYLFSYLSGIYWYSYRNKNNQFRVHVANNVSKSYTGETTDLIFEDTIYDPLDLYDRTTSLPFFPGQYLYPPAGQENIDLHFKLTCTLVLPATPANMPAPTFLFYIYQDRPADGEFFQPIAELYQGIPGQAQEIQVNINKRIEGVMPGDLFGILMTYHDTITPGGIDYPFEIRPGAECKFEPDPPRYIEDDLITLGDLLNPEINALQLIKGMQHLINGVTEPRFSEKKLVMHVPYNTIIEGNAVEGFYLGEVLDLSEKVQAGSRKRRNLEDTKPRFLDLQFKKSTDEYIISRKYPKEYFSKRVEVGGRIEEVLTLENPLFEPTIEIATTVEEIGIRPDASTVNETPALMALWDNDNSGDEKQLSREIGPRIAYHYGFVKQQKPGGTEDFEFVFEGVAIPQFGYLSQWPTRKITADKIYRPVYADSSSDFYTTCWAYSILKDMFKTEEYNYLISLSEQEYRDLNFRKNLIIQYEGTKLLRAITVRDFRPGLSTPVVAFEEYENKEE